MACPACVQGGIHEGKPQGYEETLFGLPCYVTSPTTSSTANETISGHIVILTDAVGWNFVNTRLLADRYARRCNAKVYIPDFMDGHAMDVSVFGSMDVLMGHGDEAAGIFSKAGALLHVVGAFIPFLWYTRQAVCQPRIEKWMRDLRQHVAGSDGKAMGAAGFCWGGKYCFILSHPPKSGIKPIDCAFTAHPSNLVLPVDAEMVASPIRVIVGDKDPLLPVNKVHEMKDVLSQKKDFGCEVTVLPGAAHGFALRARLGDKQAVEQGKTAEDIAVKWFKDHFL